MESDNYRVQEAGRFEKEQLISLWKDQVNQVLQRLKSRK